MRYPKKYTKKEWSHFSWEIQEILCMRYIVFLTDYQKPKTTKQKIFQVIDKLSVKNLNKGITKFNSGMAEFSKVVAAPKTRRSIGHDYHGGTDMMDALGAVKHANLMGKSKSANIWGTPKTKTKRRRSRKKIEPEGIAFWGKSKGGVW